MSALEPQDRFRDLLLRVVGQALAAAGYTLDNRPLEWAGGLYRFRCDKPDGGGLWVEYQALLHPDHPSRFQVFLRRGSAEHVPLSRLVWDVFGVHILLDADHWWAFQSERELADALLESGKLLVGFGLPWLDGSLRPCG